MVYKVQRNNQLLRDIEGGPNDQDYSMILSTEEMMPTNHPPQLIQQVEEEILGGDMCSKRAINWGKGKPQPVKQVLMPQKNQQNMQQAQQMPSKSHKYVGQQGPPPIPKSSGYGH